MSEEEKTQETQPTQEENTTVDEGKETVETQDTPDETPEEDKPDEKENVNLENSEDVSKALDSKGIDYAALSEEYFTTGKLSEKSMANLAAVGITDEMVNDYIEGAKARAEIERNELAQCVGGRENMEEIVKWAAQNLKKEEIVAINAIRNKFELESVLIGLKTKMEEKEGKLPNYQIGGGDKTAVAGFRSQAEMFEAIRDPRYKVDEAYRDDVQKKIAASREAGVDLGNNY